jgi:hypothetical protein
MIKHLYGQIYDQDIDGQQFMKSDNLWTGFFGQGETRPAAGISPYYNRI